MNENKWGKLIKAYAVPPCGKCEDRHEGCHGDCERYKEYKAELERVRAAKNKEKVGYDVEILAGVQRKETWRKRRRKG